MNKKITHKFSKSKIRNISKFIKKKIILIMLSFLLYSFYSMKSNIKKNILINSNLNLVSKTDHFKLLLPKYKMHKYNKKDNSSLFKLKDSYDYKKMKETGKDKYIYDVCTVTKAKHENLYVRDFIEYYLNLGVDKFYFGDDNEEYVENLSDILQDYVTKGLVDINYVYYRNMSHELFFDESFRAVKYRCKWILFIDVDEYLEFTDKNMNIKTYLNMPIFDKCDVIRIHWLIYDDNNLVYYDERPVFQRLNHSVFHNINNRYHKSIVRGKDYKGVLFDRTMHQPVMSTIPNQCDAIGNFETLGLGTLGFPKYKYCYFRHYKYKTAEEFSLKLLRGRHRGIKYKIEYKIDQFFRLNTFTEKKLKVIERILNRTFPKYHGNYIY